MNERGVHIQAATCALKRSASAALAERKRHHYGSELRALLLLEPNCTELPSALVEDGVLEAVDKVIWLVLMARARAGGGITVFPTQLELARSANVTARQTVSRSLSILRCRRRLTVCQTAWRKGGRQKGSAYALHPTPLPIEDTIYLDPHYPAFLEQLSGQRKDRVQKAACDEVGQLSHWDNGHDANHGSLTKL